jgi:uncharacterized protein DUF397
MSSISDFAHVVWEKSSYSNGSGGQCLEFAPDFDGVVPVRDSKNYGPALVVPADAWAAFVEHIRS